LKVDDGVLWLKVPTDFVAEFIQEKYLPLIKSTMNKVLGRELDIRFLSEGPFQSHKPPELPSKEPLWSNECNLHQRYDFDSFVVGSGNRFAHAAARAVAEAPSFVYNPLVIYGSAGLGKTHLTQAIGNYVRRVRPELRILFTPTENFMNDMISAIQNQTTISFKKTYREKDLLLIDDIHFLANKEGLQEEIFHTFNTLYDAGKQIVMTSDRPPKDIPTLQERLVSRFHWGLVVDLQPPDLETRIAILRKKCDVDGIVLPEDVIYYIASEVKSNIRELEGSLIRLLAYSSCHNVDVTLEVAREVLKDMIAVTSNLCIDDIVTAVAAHFGLSEEAIKGPRRLASVALPRQIAMHMARRLTNSSLKEIGTHFGRDHSTVIHACEKVEKLMQDNSQIKQTEETLARTLCG
jgi:chromosomal replication initiator protein